MQWRKGRRKLVEDRHSCLSGQAGVPVLHHKEAAMPHILLFLLGAAAAGVLKVIGGPIARPIVKGTIKGGIKVGRQVQEWAAEVTEDLQDVAAEANAELEDAPKTAKRKSAKGR